MTDSSRKHVTNLKPHLSLLHSMCLGFAHLQILATIISKFAPSMLAVLEDTIHKTYGCTRVRGTHFSDLGSRVIFDCAQRFFAFFSRFCKRAHLHISVTKYARFFKLGVILECRDCNRWKKNACMKIIF